MGFVAGCVTKFSRILANQWQIDARPYRTHPRRISAFFGKSLQIPCLTLTAPAFR
jgi:hypothetical protein